MDTSEPIKGATWYETDYPVLRAAAALCSASGFNSATSDELVATTGFEKPRVVSSIARLSTRYLNAVSQNSMTTNDYLVTGLTAEGLIAADVWPSSDAMQERFIAALEQLIENTPAGSPRASKLEGVLGAIRDLTTGTSGNVFGQLITSAMGA